MKTHLLPLLGACILCNTAFGGELDDKTVVLPQKPKVWFTFPLSSVRLLPTSPFHAAMMTCQQYLLDMNIELMLNPQRRAAGLPEKPAYPGSNQPVGTRAGDRNHYLSAISLMHAQTGDERFLQRVNYIVNTMKECQEKAQSASDGRPGNSDRRRQGVYDKLLSGQLDLARPDEAGYPWDANGGGNFWYGVHKELAGLRDAYLYCSNKTALELLIRQAEPITVFALKANPDLFDGMLDVEHGGMNEVFADLYALTGDKRYMEVSLKLNHQKVILNLALGKDVLYGRHANMQIPTFVGTARQYQLTGDEVSGKATENFLNIVYGDHTSAIGGNSCYERFCRPGETTKLLSYSGNETCNTYNMLKVALNYFEATGDLKHMEYFERAVYNHILASQDPASGGVTYYTTLMPGLFKSFSNRFDLSGVWCCVGTGMENHSKYGEAIYFHNGKDLFVNLFIASELAWKNKGLRLSMETRFPGDDNIVLKVKENGSFDGQICIRYPLWARRPARIEINRKAVAVTARPGDYIRLSSAWKTGDVITVEMPQDFRLEAAKDDPNMIAIFHGPLVLAGELGAERMPGSDHVRAAADYGSFVPPTDDIPVLIANKVNPDNWLKSVPGAPLKFETVKAGVLNGKTRDISLIPYYQIRHERLNVYWKLYSPEEFAYRKQIVSDEVNPASEADEQLHNRRGEKDALSRPTVREDDRLGRMAKDGGWFSYDLKLNKQQEHHYLVVTYWGSEVEKHEFDVVVGNVVVRSENLHNKWPLTYYEEAYELPRDLLQGKDRITVKFASKPGFNAGTVYALKVTSDPHLFPNYLFYGYIPPMAPESTNAN